MIIDIFRTSPKRFFNRILFFLMSAFFLLALVSSAGAGNEGKIALVMKALSNPFFSSMESGAKSYARHNNISLEVFGVERETDVQRQIGIVDNLISRGYGAIVIAPADSKKLLPVCKKALDQKRVVVNIDNPFHKESMDQLGIAIPFVGSDNKVGATLIGKYICRKLKGQGRAIVIEGIRGVENADLRRAGFILGLTENSQIRVVASASANWHTDEAFSLAVNLLKTHRKVDAILCANDKMALGVLQALDILDLTGKVLVAGYDNIPTARYEMQNARMHATAEQHPELMGQYGVELAWRALKGEKIPQYVPTPIDLVTYEALDKTIALSISDLENSFFRSLYESAQKAARLFGTRLVVSDAGNRHAQQLTDISSFLDQKVAALIVNPTNSETVIPGIELANARNVPVITVDRESRGGQVFCHIASNNLEGGRMAARALGRYLKGSGKVIEMEGIPGTSAAHERGSGFNDALRAYPDVKVVGHAVGNFDRKAAHNAMKRFIQKKIDFDAVFAHNDNMLFGVLDALQEANDQRKRILIGFDAIKEAVNAVRQGKITATIAQEPEKMGSLAVRSAVRFLRNEELPAYIPVPLQLIEKKRNRRCSIPSTTNFIPSPQY